jgi:hypothetical protein
MPTVQAPKVIVRDEAKRAIRKRQQIVVHDLQVKTMKVRDFTRNVQGEYLSLSVGSQFRPKNETRAHKAAFCRSIPFSNNELPGSEPPNLYRQLLDGLDILPAQGIGTGQFSH